MSKRNFLRLAALALLLGLIVGVVAERLCVNTARAGLLLTHAGLAGAVGLIDPTTVPGLALWIDPSDATTVFTDTACTAAASSPGALLCIKDKSTHGCNMTHTGATTITWTQVSTSPAIGTLSFNGIEILSSSCLSMFQNVPRAIIFISAQASSTSTSGPVLYASIGTDVTLARFEFGYGVSGGVGWTIRGRSADGDGGANAAQGTALTTVMGARGDIEYINAAPNMALTTNPGAAVVTGATVTTSQNSANTPSVTAVTMGQDPSAAASFTGPVYQLLVYTPASALSPGTMAQLDTFVCARAGITC